MIPFRRPSRHRHTRASTPPQTVLVGDLRCKQHHVGDTGSGRPGTPAPATAAASVTNLAITLCKLRQRGAGLAYRSHRTQVAVAERAWPAHEHLSVVGHEAGGRADRADPDHGERLSCSESEAPVCRRSVETLDQVSAAWSTWRRYVIPCAKQVNLL